MCVEDGEQSVQTDLHQANIRTRGKQKYQGYMCTGRGMTINVTDVPIFTPEHVRPHDSWLCSRIPEMRQGLNTFFECLFGSCFQNPHVSHTGISHHILISSHF